MESIFLKIFTGLICVTGVIWISNKFISYNEKKKRFIKNIEIQKKNYYNNDIKQCKNTCLIQSIGSLFPILLLIFIIRCFIYEPFYVCSQSMLPSLSSGDYIIVKKYIYGISNPFTNNKFMIYNHPKRGDIIIFKPPHNLDTSYIKRVIAIPGDKITYDSVNKKITIYKNYSNNHNNKVFINYSMIKKENKVNKEKNNIFTSIKNIIGTTNNIPKLNKHDIIYQENINHYKYNITISNIHKNMIKFYFHQYNQPKQTWLVPKNKYFVMGDNRDNSIDSRYFGFVSENNIVGKADYIWMHIEKKEHQWPTGINISRIGKIN